MSEAEITEEELAAIAAALWVFSDGETMMRAVKVREVWPQASPWRWAPIGRS